MIVENAKVALGRKNDLASWSKSHDRMIPETWAALTPNFTFEKGATVYTIGSCFARNIEEHLSLIGCDIPTLDFVTPKSEWSGLRSNGILNKYTPAAIYADISWVEAIMSRDTDYQNSDADMFRFDLDDGEVIDLQLGGYVPVSLERFYERRREIFELTRKAFKADCVTLTLGMIEAWKLGNMYVQQPPANRKMLRRAGEFEFVTLDYGTVFEMVNETINLIQKHNPDVKFLITTSPVPMGRTFTQDDVIIANMTSKATLRTVATQIAALRENVDYFPSFEAVILSPRELAFGPDLLHVRDGFVGKIVEHLIKYYFSPENDVAGLLQRSRIELDSGDQCDMQILKQARDVDADLGLLSVIQVTTYLRIAWRLRDKALARKAGLELMKREDRTHDSLRAIAHVFPKIGFAEQAAEYATEILERDPNNDLAQRILA